MFGDSIRPGPSGEGVPVVRYTRFTSHWRDIDGNRRKEDGAMWDVTVPDPWGHFQCCGRTYSRGFESWREAVCFALSGRWT